MVSKGVLLWHLQHLQATYFFFKANKENENRICMSVADVLTRKKTKTTMFFENIYLHILINGKTMINSLYLTSVQV